MRTLNRNKVLVGYANYTDKAELTDENGLYTGEFGVGYTEPQFVKVNVSASKGEASTEMFGTDLNYTKKIAVSKDLGWTENTVLWIDKAITETYNYKVVGIAKSLNSVTYAIRGVDVS